MPQISYGPPGHRGVSQLVAVGDVDPGNRTDDLVHKGIYLGGATVLAGVLLGSKAVRNLGAGATAALLAVCWASKRGTAVVTTAPAPAPAAGW